MPQMIATKRVPDEVAWGTYPTLSASVTSKASEVYNVLVHSFTPGAFKGIVFLGSEAMVAEDQGAHYGEQLAALAKSWRKRFTGDPAFFYTIPGKRLAGKITAPVIEGVSEGVEITDWEDDEAIEKLIDVVERSY